MDYFEQEMNKYLPTQENFTGKKTTPGGTQLYFVDGKLHREDGPAVIWASGKVEFFLCGKKKDNIENWTSEVRKMKLDKLKYLWDDPE